MVRIAVAYVTIVVVFAALILLNPLDFMGRGAREALRQGETDVAVVAEAPAVAEPVAEAGAATVEGTHSALLDDPLIKEISASILADLMEAAAKEREAAGGSGAASLSDISAQVLEGVKTGTAPTDKLAGLVALSLIDRKTDAAIDELVNQVVAEGLLEPPEALRTTEGKVDTAVLLASILAEAQAEEFGQGDLSEPAALIEGGTAALQAATEDVLYTVAPGDSLGSLALMFYGDADLYLEIYKANRQVMDTPQSLRGGMKLLIPAKSRL